MGLEKIDIEMHSRPSGPVAEEILSIVRDLTGEWFTPNVAAATPRDLLFHDVVCVRQNNRVRAFAMFTSHDGAIQITLMGTSPGCRGRGFGSALIKSLVARAKEMGFTEIVVFTVPPSAKPVYQATLDFYQRRGFRVVKEYTELWEHGALELRKPLSRP
jgi:ribosomal protein S18 acetylase RimI-like enzyme